MKQYADEDVALKKFLLGELSAEEQIQIEERLFLDADYFRQLRAAEDDLIDEFLYDGLSADERERFNNTFLTTPERRESLRVARALREYISRNPPRPAPAPAKKSLFDVLFGRGPLLQFSLAALALLIFAGLAWLALRRAGPPGAAPAPSIARKEEAPTPPPQVSPADTATPVARDSNSTQNNGAAPGETPRARTGGERVNGRPRLTPPPAPRPGPLYSFLLLPIGNVRGEGDVNRVKIPAGESVVEFHLQLIEETGRQRYQASLNTDGGPATGTWTNLKPSVGRSGKIVRVPVPTKLLKPGAHRLTLAEHPSRGQAQIISTYDFRVVE